MLLEFLIDGDLQFFEPPRRIDRRAASVEVHVTIIIRDGKIHHASGIFKVAEPKLRSTMQPCLAVPAGSALLRSMSSFYQNVGALVMRFSQN